MRARQADAAASLEEEEERCVGGDNQRPQVRYEVMDVTRLQYEVWSTAIWEFLWYANKQTF